MLDTIVKKALEQGFTVAKVLDCSTLNPMIEVRQMCASDKCQKYGKNWACPPGCGTLEECTKDIKSYNQGIIVQTVGEIEDSFDFEGMADIEEKHRNNFKEFLEELNKEFSRILPLGAGCCNQCIECSYPNKECRFPKKAMSSMEAFGLLVSQVCSDNNTPYYYGTGTLAFTGCYLFDGEI